MESMLIKARFEAGKGWREFYESSGEARKGFDEVEASLRRDEEFLGFLGDWTPMNVLALGQTWCPDVIHHFPLLGKLEAWVPGLRVRFLDSSKEPELMAHFNGGASKTIPVIAFYDRDFNEHGRVKGRMPKAKAWMVERIAGRPAADLPKDEVAWTLREFNRLFVEEFVRETYAEIRYRLTKICLI